MNIHADKTSENKSQVVANSLPKLQSSESTFQFVENGPEAIAKRKLQEMINNSPRVQQLKAYQKMANKSTRVKQLIQLQTMVDNYYAKQQQAAQKKVNNTGLSDNLKTGMETLSGMSLDDVKVHQNSDKPAQLQAHAYAQGTDIHIASGQEKHLPHEAWHVVQQKQGRVKPTMQMMGKINVNDDAGLEQEADVMGEKAQYFNQPAEEQKLLNINFSTNDMPVQRVLRIGLLNSVPSAFFQGRPAAFIEQLTPALAERGITNITQEQWNFIFDQLALIAQDQGMFDYATTTDIITEIYPNNTAHNVMAAYLARQPQEAIDDEEIIHDVSTARKRPRTRQEHNLSDGESESEDVTVLWRSLRSDENVGQDGLRPPKGHAPLITASAHIAAGSRAKVKSPWVSLTRSRKVAGAWASQSDKRVAKVAIPPQKFDSGDAFDITNPDHASQVFPTGKGSSLNTAKASQEVVVRGGVGSEQILALYEARKITVSQYEDIKKRMKAGEEIFIDGHKLYAAFRTRTTTTSTPQPRVLLELPYIRRDEVIKLIVQEFSSIENEDGSRASIPPLDDSLLNYSVNNATNAAEAAFLYTDIYFSMTS